MTSNILKNCWVTTLNTLKNCNISEYVCNKKNTVRNSLKYQSYKRLQIHEEY